MTRTRKLPTASPATVLRLFLDVLLKPHAGPEYGGREYSVETLAQLDVPQPKRARALLTFLDLLTDAGCLQPTLAEVGANRRRLRQLLCDKLAAGCGPLKCTPEHLAGFGSEDLPSEQLGEGLQTWPPIRNERNGQTRSNMVRCLRTLHFAILHLDDRDRLEGELAGHERKNRRRNAPDDVSVAVEQVRRTAPNMGRRATTATVDPLAGTRMEAATGRPWHGGAHTMTRTDTTECVIHQLGRFSVDYTADNHPVYAEVYCDQAATADILERLANQLLDQAAAMRRGPGF